MIDATQAMTVLAEIDQAQRATLQARLDAIAAKLDDNEVFRPKDLPHTHFMRFAIIEADGELPALLAWEANHDREASAYLAEVVAAAPSIAQVFGCCRDFPVSGSDDARIAWLLDHRVRAAAFYTGYRGVPREQVVNDRAIHDELRKLIDAPGGRAALAGLSDHAVHRYLLDHVRTHCPHLDTSPPPSDAWRWRLGKLFAIVVAALLILVLSPVLLGWYLVLRAKEKRDVADRNTRPVHDDKGLAAFEDRVTQNQLTHIVPIKPGWFRLATLTIVLFAIEMIARVHAVNGHLGGITSIHFARWVIIHDRWSSQRDRHRLLFFSNYDGSWESYLGEFVDRAAYGLTGVWSNTVGFPDTRHLIRDGARDEEAFKQWTRRHQIASQVWWSGVPDSTVQNIRDDVWLRDQLGRKLDDVQVRAWLRTL